MPYTIMLKHLRYADVGMGKEEFAPKSERTQPFSSIESLDDSRYNTA